VLEAARLSGAVKRIVYASTIWVYSDCKQPNVDEDTPLSAPSHFYTATKLASEHYCLSYSKLYNLGVTILRYGIPYGPRARGGTVVPIFVNKAMNNEPITIAGDGSQFRKFVYVEDLADGNVAALNPNAKNRIYNLEGNEKVTIKQIAETVKKILGTDTKIEHTPARPGDFAGAEISNERAKKELGWEPKVNFEEGVRRYVEWFRVEKENEEKKWKQLDETLRKGI
jgi:UDP-glucose 4-epimerase